MPGQAIVTIRDNQWQVWLATTPTELARGLSRIPSIPAGTGMLFLLPGNQVVSVTTQSLYFPIDIIFVSSDLEVIDVARNVPPGMIVTENTPVSYILEVNAGETAGIGSGDVVDITVYQAAGTNSWISPLISLAGLMAVGAFMAVTIRRFTAMLEEPEIRPMLLPQTRKELTRKWYDKGVEAGKSDGWMDVENTIKETAQAYPEIKDAHELVWSDIDLWEQTDHFNILYGSKMWEDAHGDIDLYSELKDAFWQGYLTGRQEIGKDVFEAARQALKALTTDRRIPFLPQVKSKRGIGLYRVNLAAPKHIEEVILENGTALLKRFNKPVSRFKPTEEQRRRIKKGKGSLVIFDWQEIEWLGTSYWPETKGKVVFIGSCKVSEGLCLTHGYSVSKTVRCPKSPLTDEEWKAAWELAETAFPEGMSNPWVNGWWPETLQEAEGAVAKYANKMRDAVWLFREKQRKAVENYERAADKAIYNYRQYVMAEYERRPKKAGVALPQTAYDKELEQLRRDLREGAISEEAYKRAVKEILAKKHKPYRSDVTVEAWQERDRLGIWITDNRTGETIAEWWDDDAREMFEQGFFKPGVPLYSWEKPSPEFVASVLDYAESVGLLARGGSPSTVPEYLPQTSTATKLDSLQVVKAFKQVSAHGEDKISVSLQAWALFPRGRRPHFISMYGSGDEYVITPLYAHISEWVHVPVTKVEVWIKSLPVHHFEPMAVAPEYREEAERLAREVDEPMAILPLPSRVKASSAVIPTAPRPRKEGDLEYLADSPEFLTQTIEAIGYRERLDSAFQDAIRRAKGLK
jgi:uncharacterized membrane protein (UPF0127 family)